jgi:hypothetical protein
MEIIDHDGRTWFAVPHGDKYIDDGPVNRTEERSILLRINGSEVRFYLGDPPNRNRHGTRVEDHSGREWY